MPRGAKPVQHGLDLLAGGFQCHEVQKSRKLIQQEEKRGVGLLEETEKFVSQSAPWLGIIGSSDELDAGAHDLDLFDAFEESPAML